MTNTLQLVSRSGIKSMMFWCEVNHNVYVVKLFLNCFISAQADCAEWSLHCYCNNLFFFLVSGLQLLLLK